ncbi:MULTISPECIES: HNH endonuclease [Halolamina]|uniref:HNH endonuclease n=1 Tax=Halolamina pelagica TaxID=699431 RepID=A0A1I5R2L8_9EURY|nr:MULTISPECIES: HNH endonuclease [Halolamina]SFP52581.1 HNH endonuclease [Halolamina pelagica]
MVRLWVLNTLPAHWERCRDGPTDADAHPERQLGHPWHGIPSGGRAPDPRELTPGEDLFVVRRTGGVGVSGVWTFEAAREVEDQEIVPDVWRDHEGETRDYDWLLYCRGSPEREVEPPMREDFGGSFPFHHSKLTGTGIAMEGDDRAAYVNALIDHGVSETAERRLRDALETPATGGVRAADSDPPARTEYTTTRTIRDTKLSTMAKELYDHRCQLCGDRRERRDGGAYAEAHHVKPLGDPHRGPDTASNLLVLCPNHHADFDYGRVRVDPDSLVVEHAYDDAVDGTFLTVDADHDLDPAVLAYHNDRIASF